MEAKTAAPACDEDLLARIRELTRALHESMRELGLDKKVEQVAQTIPDARDRLAYIAETTKQAADRALSAIEVAQPIQAELRAQAQALTQRWDNGPDARSAAADLIVDTRAYLKTLPAQTAQIGSQLHEIMMAQDFQDLTGQVIMKLIDMIHELESRLVEVLIDYGPEDFLRSRLGTADESLLNGPQINADGQVEVVADQAQVDALLDELGF